MANDTGTEIPSGQPQGADDTSTANPQDGTRADTSRVADDTTKPAEKPSEKSYSFKEDRSDWVPRQRLNDESGKRTRAETEIASLRQELELRDKRLRLAMGLDVPSKDEQEATEIREALYRVNPKLRLLDKLNEQDIERLLSAAESAESTTSAQWARHREEMLGSLEAEVADQLNLEKLSEVQVNRLRRDFKAYARDEARKRAVAEQTQDPTYNYDNDFVARYERGDKTLLTEFAKGFLDDWVTPVRRQANVSTLQRQGRPVPRGERTRQNLTQGPPNIDYNNEDAFQKALLDARRGGDAV